MKNIDTLENILDKYYAPIKLPDYNRTNLIQALNLYIEERVAEATTPTHIMGKPIDEVIMILSALELERIEDLKMTMTNLDEWMKRVRDDHHKAMQKAIRGIYERKETSVFI